MGGDPGVESVRGRVDRAACRALEVVDRGGGERRQRAPVVTQRVEGGARRIRLEELPRRESTVRSDRHLHALPHARVARRAHVGLAPVDDRQPVQPIGRASEHQQRRLTQQHVEQGPRRCPGALVAPRDPGIIDCGQRREIGRCLRSDQRQHHLASVLAMDERCHQERIRHGDAHRCELLDDRRRQHRLELRAAIVVDTLAVPHRGRHVVRHGAAQAVPDRVLLPGQHREQVRQRVAGGREARGELAGLHPPRQQRAQRVHERVRRAVVASPAPERGRRQHAVRLPADGERRQRTIGTDVREVERAAGVAHRVGDRRPEDRLEPVAPRRRPHRVAHRLRYDVRVVVRPGHLLEDRRRHPERRREARAVAVRRDRACRCRDRRACCVGRGPRREHA